MANTHTLAKPAPKTNNNHISGRTWLAVIGSVLGSFMAILDIQITNASLKEIQGALSVSGDEISWITTAYLVAEIVVTPLSGWLAQVFSIRLYLLGSATLFTIFSLGCGQAWDLNSMIAFRILQGFAGGALIPMALTIILTSLPPAKQPTGLAIFALAVTFAPAIGPVLGGWLTESYGWKYIFYINLIPGGLLLFNLWFALDSQPLHLKLLKKGDWGGIVSMAMGLGSLQIVLEEGSREDWFSSDLIVRFSLIAVVFLVLFLWIEFTRKEPFINLHLFSQWNFALGTLIFALFGLGLFGSLYLLPVYLGQIQGYNALQIGKVMIWAGLPQLFIIPLVPQLMQRIDARLLLGLGLMLFAISCLMNSQMTHETGADQLYWSQLVRALGQPFIITPLASISTAKIPKKDASSASSLNNTIRNLGGSLGIAILATLLTQRQHFHSDRIGESISLYNLQTQERFDQLAQLFISQGSDPLTADNQAMAMLDNLVRREAYVMAYNDCFYIIAIIFLLGCFLVLFLKKACIHTNTSRLRIKQS